MNKHTAHTANDRKTSNIDLNANDAKWYELGIYHNNNNNNNTINSNNIRANSYNSGCNKRRNKKLIENPIWTLLEKYSEEYC